MTRALQRYEALLRLYVVAGTTSPAIGEGVTLELTLSNTCDRTVAACLGPVTTYTLLAVPLAMREQRPPVDQQGGTVDHPYCARRFRLAPGEQLSWREVITVRDIGPGEADLAVQVQVVHPQDCDRYGCYDTMIAAAPVRLHLRRASPGLEERPH